MHVKHVEGPLKMTLIAAQLKVRFKIVPEIVVVQRWQIVMEIAAAQRQMMLAVFARGMVQPAILVTRQRSSLFLTPIAPVVMEAQVDYFLHPTTISWEMMLLILVIAREVYLSKSLKELHQALKCRKIKILSMIQPLILLKPG